MVYLLGYFRLDGRDMFAQIDGTQGTRYQDQSVGDHTTVE